ncbi:2-oxoglutarate and iron-dependent oxygenase domain-containing protein [Paraburkholderia sp.]|uniref:isopenicillin N synthase family dioxygenase n=1 Tax=Paraburkholderia sp. TaxID=1926495 RepID=UPI00238504D6|nr:2-oxoglutarate and iron-dependent oxygenase domain-containing protein [Paraburkholderia sp.]MDE1182654.1 2-oxoglutarate and iron-dependent oxygenase domain-containing protein [Paraburkholderia sp.]
MTHTHTRFQHLPIVDVAGLYSDDLAQRLSTAQELGRAARDAGFFYVTGHRVSSEQRGALVNQAKRFFAAESGWKMRYYIGHSISHRGYVPEGEEVFASGKRDRKEAFDTGRELPSDDPDVVAGTPMLGPNNWPDQAGFRDAVGGYYDAAFELGQTLFRGFSLALGLDEDHFEAYLKKPPSQLRLIHYPVDLSAEDRPGIGAHTDYECFTILMPTAPGLEVMNGAGEWIDAPPVEGAFVVNIGDMLEVWTGGAYVATSHRVRKVKEERYSFPLFFACDYHTVVAPLPAFATPESLEKYPPVCAGDHLFAQTAQSFTYLKEKMERGELVLPDGSRALASFGQQARYAGVASDL